MLSISWLRGSTALSLALLSAFCPEALAWQSPSAKVRAGDDLSADLTARIRAGIGERRRLRTGQPERKQEETDYELGFLEDYLASGVTTAAKLRQLKGSLEARIAAAQAELARLNGAVSGRVPASERDRRRSRKESLEAELFAHGRQMAVLDELVPGPGTRPATEPDPTNLRRGRTPAGLGSAPSADQPPRSSIPYQ